MNHSGQTAPILLILIAAMALIAYLMITTSLPFNDHLFSQLYPKPPSHAFEEITPPSPNAEFTPTKNWLESWNTNSLNDWSGQASACSLLKNNTLNLNCTSTASLTTKTKFSKDSSIIITGSFSSSPNSPASIGLANNNTPYFTLSTTPSNKENDLTIENYTPGSTQKFKIVTTKIGNNQFVYYYLGDSSEPVKKAQITINQNPGVFLSCSGSCSFDPLTVSAVTANN